MKLEKLGWNGFFEAQWNSQGEPGEKPARVTAQHREAWEVCGEFGECQAHVSGRLRLAAEEGGDWPAVGDWLGVSGAASGGLVIRAVLPRRTAIVRKVAGKRMVAQVLAANVDTVFLMMGLDGDYNPGRLERYLSQMCETGARIAVLLNKADLCANGEAKAEEIRRLALGADVLCTSAASGAGLGGLDRYLDVGQTVVLLGSSGVGKSTLLNRLFRAQVQSTSAVREGDDRGRHTTTARQVFFLPGGAMVIDTPGLRELQLWNAKEGLQHAFEDIEALAQRCRFRDCTHNGEPDCAVAAAMQCGELDARRFENHRKLLREQAFLERKVDHDAQQDAKNRSKGIQRAVRQLYRQRDKQGKQ